MCTDPDECQNYSFWCWTILFAKAEAKKCYDSLYHLYSILFHSVQ